MKFVIQRVKNAEVTVDKKVVGKINQGFLVLVGVTHEDTFEIADYMIKKLINLRVFNDENDKMNLALKNVNGELLLISQFTLYANCQRGNRPEFISAAKPDKANEIYEYIIKECKLCAPLSFTKTDYEKYKIAHSFTTLTDSIKRIHEEVKDKYTNCERDKQNSAVNDVVGSRLSANI